MHTHKHTHTRFISFVQRSNGQRKQRTKENDTQVCHIKRKAENLLNLPSICLCWCFAHATTYLSVHWMVVAAARYCSNLILPFCVWVCCAGETMSGQSMRCSASMWNGCIWRKAKRNRTPQAQHKAIIQFFFFSNVFKNNKKKTERREKTVTQTQSKSIKLLSLRCDCGRRL